MTLQPKSLPPFLSYGQAKMPISRIKGRLFIIGFISRTSSLNNVTIIIRIIINKRSHKSSRLLYHISILTKKFLRRTCTIDKFWHINDMGLLPDNKRANIRWCLFRRWISHFHPTYAIKSLSGCNITCHRHGSLIPFQLFLQKICFIPKRIMKTVPHYHF